MPYLPIARITNDSHSYTQKLCIELSRVIDHTGLHQICPSNCLSYVHTHTYKHMHIPTHTHTHTNTHTYTDTNTYTHAHPNNTHTRTQTHTNKTRTHTPTHTHTHTHTQREINMFPVTRPITLVYKKKTFLKVA